ncbi:DNA protecting protein DprA [Calothrix sp. HK-06]|nr:DNA protecting protein DprA [Calothrix sp. HK-06]
MPERAYWLAWSQISGVGPVLLQRLHQHFGSLQAAWEVKSSELGAVEGFGFNTIQKVGNERASFNKTNHPEEFLAKHLKENPDFWTPVDDEYPRLLMETASPPPILYYRGAVELEENLGQKGLIGIVGTRQPSEYGVRWTRQISTALAKNGFTVVSGMAEGIDSESHVAALKADGRTIAVFGTGVDVVYPAKNQKLYQQILKQGMVVSEFSSKTPPDRTHFPRRNRIIAGLCRAVLVIEAPIKSGALITADYANEFGRDVYALPGRVDDYNSQGCLKLIAQGATPIPSELDELIKMLGAIPQFDSIPAKPVKTALPQLEPELQKVIETVSMDSTTFDVIIQQTGMAPGLVSSALLQLELMGLIAQLPGMRYQRC